MLSQYISGWNTTLSLKTHEATIPSQPALGRALSKFEIELPVPHLRIPAPPSDPSDPSNPDTPDGDEGEREGTHFVKDATMHLITSSATFTLLSPLRHSTIFIESINATAFYPNEDTGDDGGVEWEEVGTIDYDLPFAVAPVDQDGNGITTPRLPVDWSLGSVGYEAVKKALGGTLRLAAEAEVGVRLGRWREVVWFKGRGIGARVRL